MTSQPLSSVASSFLKVNAIDRDTASRLQKEATTAKIPFVTHLVKSKTLPAMQAAQILAEQSGSPYFDIGSLI